MDNDELQRPDVKLVFTVLGDTLDSLLFIFAALEDSVFEERQAAGAEEERRTTWQPPHAALHRVTWRLQALEPPLCMLSKGQPLNWDASSILSSGSLALFWRQHFPNCTHAPVKQILAALSESCRNLITPDMLQGLVPFLRPDTAGSVSLADMALALDGWGLWQGVLFYTSWTDLCHQEVLKAVSGWPGNINDRLENMPASELAVEKRQKQRSLLLPDLTCEQFFGSNGGARARAALIAFRTMGLQVAMEVPGKSSASRGLVLQFVAPRMVNCLLQKSSALVRIYSELVAETMAACSPPASALAGRRILRSISETSLDQLGVNDVRQGQHVLLLRTYQRMQLLYEDAVSDVIFLQQEQDALRKEHIKAIGGDPLPNQAAQNGQPGLNNLLQQSFEAFQMEQAGRIAQIEADMQANEKTNDQEPIEPQLKRIEIDARFADREVSLNLELDYRMARQALVRDESLPVEQALSKLEADIAEAHTKHAEEAAEAELIQLDKDLTCTKEAACKVAEDVNEARGKLAEKLGLAEPLPDIGELEAQLAKELEELAGQLSQATADSKKA